MKKTNSILKSTLTSGILATALLSGCNTAEVRRVDTTGGGAIMTRDQINVQEWYPIANEMVNNMLNAGVFRTAPMSPATIKVSIIEDKTMKGMDTTFLTDEIINQLNQSRQAVVAATYKDMRGQSEDALAARAKEERDASQQLLDEFKGDYDVEKDIKKTMDEIPFFTLSGSVVEDYVKQGNVRQSTYIVNLRLIETTSGKAIWTGRSTPLTKQSKNASVGW